MQIYIIMLMSAFFKYLDFCVLVAHQVKVRQKLIPLVLPNMLIFLVYVMVCMSNHILFTSKQRKFYYRSTGLKEDN